MSRVSSLRPNAIGLNRRTLMLRANVGLSRKVTRDFQSTGYSVNLDGEIPFSVDDPEAVIAKVKELFDLAQEALNQEVDRDQSEDAIGRRDKPSAENSTRRNTTKTQPQTPKPSPAEAPSENGNERNGSDEAATNKQVQFILTIGKRSKLSTPQLESRIGQIVGRTCSVYDLTKKEAGRVLDELTNSNTALKQTA